MTASSASAPSAPADAEPRVRDAATQQGREVIITCAVTGSIHTPSMSPHLAITPQEIAEQAVDAARAGAAVLHLHVRDPQDGRPSPRADLFHEVVERITSQVDAVINISTGGGHNMTVDERLQAALALKPEMASLNMGSMNFGLYPALAKGIAWRYDWEPRYLENTRDFVFRNTFRDIEIAIEKLYDGCGTRFEFECYDVGHLYNLAHFVDRGLVRPPFFVQSIFGILGGIGADHENVTHMRRIADKLFGKDYRWSVLAAGRHQIGSITQAAILGGHVRVGLEDNLYLRKGRLARNCAEQVELARGILERLSFSIASPQSARRELGLRGTQEAS